jgi:hypothetical protein
MTSNLTRDTLMTSFAGRLHQQHSLNQVHETFCVLAHYASEKIEESSFICAIVLSIIGVGCCVVKTCNSLPV